MNREQNAWIVNKTHESWTKRMNREQNAWIVNKTHGSWTKRMELLKQSYVGGCCGLARGFDITCLLLAPPHNFTIAKMRWFICASIIVSPHRWVAIPPRARCWVSTKKLRTQAFHLLRRIPALYFGSLDRRLRPSVEPPPTSRSGRVRTPCQTVAYTQWPVMGAVVILQCAAT